MRFWIHSGFVIFSSTKRFVFTNFLFKIEGVYHFVPLLYKYPYYFYSLLLWCHEIESCHYSADNAVHALIEDQLKSVSRLRAGRGIYWFFALKEVTYTHIRAVRLMYYLKATRQHGCGGWSRHLWAACREPTVDYIRQLTKSGVSVGSTFASIQLMYRWFIEYYNSLKLFLASQISLIPLKLNSESILSLSFLFNFLANLY